MIASPPLFGESRNLFSSARIGHFLHCIMAAGSSGAHLVFPLAGLTLTLALRWRVFIVLLRRSEKSPIGCDCLLSAKPGRRANETVGALGLRSLEYHRNRADNSSSTTRK